MTTTHDDPTRSESQSVFTVPFLALDLGEQLHVIQMAGKYIAMLISIHKWLCLLLRLLLSFFSGNHKQNHCRFVLRGGGPLKKDATECVELGLHCPPVPYSDGAFAGGARAWQKLKLESELWLGGFKLEQTNQASKPSQAKPSQAKQSKAKQRRKQA